jgi:hypothetical protein
LALPGIFDEAPYDLLEKAVEKEIPNFSVRNMGHGLNELGN